MTTTRLAAGLLTLLAATTASARPPTLERLFPSGGQQGTTVEVTATGTFDHWPVQGWSEDPGIEVTAGKEKGALVVRIAADVKPGAHWIRLADDEGASSLQPFLVGTLPEVVEKESDDPIVLPEARVTINGRLERRGDIDEFAVNLKKGQTLVAAVVANRRLASPMDAVLQIASADGIVLAQNDDDHGLDPLTTLDAPADGTYRVRIFAFPATPDSTIGFAGASNYIYRLTVTTGGYLDHGYPLAVARSDPGRVEAHGWNVPPQALRVDLGADPSVESAAVAHPLLANSDEIRVVSHPTSVEQGPTNFEHPQPIAVPSTVTGRIAPAKDVDVFAFAGKKGQALSFAIESRTLGTPLDPVLRITDAKGKILSEVDDMGSSGRRRGGGGGGGRGTQSRDPQLTFTPAEDGTYRLVVRDLHGHGGERFVYLLTASQPEPDYQLTIASDHLSVAPGQSQNVAVTVDRKNGFKGTVEVRAEGLPDGVVAAPVRSESSKTTSGSVTLVLTAKAGPASGPFRIVGRVPDGSHRPRVAVMPLTGFDAATDQPWLTVLKPAAAGAKRP